MNAGMFTSAVFSLDKVTPTGARRLIVNADGFGFGAGATQGIIDAVKEGRFISSVSVNANFPEAERIVELVREFPHVSVGVHLNSVVGTPCLPTHQVSSLVGPDGLFQRDRFLELLKRGSIVLEELEAELNAQIAKIKALVGNHLTHLDSQAHTHLSYLGLFFKLARKWRLNRMRNNASLICLESRLPVYSRVKVYLMQPHVWLAHRYRQHQMKQ